MSFMSLGTSSVGRGITVELLCTVAARCVLCAVAARCALLLHTVTACCHCTLLLRTVAVHCCCMVAAWSLPAVTAHCCCLMVLPALGAGLWAGCRFMAQAGMQAYEQALGGGGWACYPL